MKLDADDNAEQSSCISRGLNGAVKALFTAFGWIGLPVFFET